MPVCERLNHGLYVKPHVTLVKGKGYPPFLFARASRLRTNVTFAVHSFLVRTVQCLFNPVSLRIFGADDLTEFFSQKLGRPGNVDRAGHGGRIGAFELEAVPVAFPSASLHQLLHIVILCDNFQQCQAHCQAH
jgi:hypothetical protein